MIKEAFKIIGSIIVIAISVPFLWWSWTTEIGQNKKPKMTEDEITIAAARAVCRDTISLNLHDSNSAEWGMNSGNWYVSWPANLDGDKITVSPEFRAKNALGMTVLSRWNCNLKRTGNDWKIVSLKQL